MANCYRCFTFMLYFIGIGPLRRNCFVFHLQTWVPNIIHLAIIALKLYMTIKFDKEISLNRRTAQNFTDYIANETAIEIVVLDEEEIALPEVTAGNLKLITVTAFFLLEGIVYRTILFTLLYRGRFVGAKIRTALKTIENGLEKPDKYKRRVMKVAVFYVSLLFVVFFVFYLIDVYEMFENTTLNCNQTLWVALVMMDSLGITISEAVCSFAIEGYLIHYSVLLENYVLEFNETLGLYENSLTIDGEDRRLQTKLDYKEIRLKLSWINAIFQRCNHFISPVLAFSMCGSLLTVCFSIFWITKNLGTFFEAPSSSVYVSLKMFVSAIRIIILCVVADYCNKKVEKTFSHLSGLQPTASADYETNQELSLLNLAKQSLSFRFTLGGFCDLRKPLLPTIAGVVITYTVILCQE